MQSFFFFQLHTSRLTNHHSKILDQIHINIIVSQGEIIKILKPKIYSNIGLIYSWNLIVHK